MFGGQQLGLAGADLLQAGGGDVDPDDPCAGVAQRERRRQSDVAEADDGDDRLLDALRLDGGRVELGGRLADLDVFEYLRR